MSQSLWCTVAVLNFVPSECNNVNLNLIKTQFTMIFSCGPFRPKPHQNTTETLHNQWSQVIIEEMSDKASPGHYQTAPKTSPEPHRRIMINIPGIWTFLLITHYSCLECWKFFTYYSSKHMYIWMKWLWLLGGWHLITATAIKPPKAACQFAADNILLYEFCYYITQRGVSTFWISLVPQTLLSWLGLIAFQ